VAVTVRRGGAGEMKGQRKSGGDGGAVRRKDRGRRV